MKSEVIEELKSDIQELKRCIDDRWAWLKEFEREAYISGDPKLKRLVDLALEAVDAQQVDIDDFQLIMFGTLDLDM